MEINLDLINNFNKVIGELSFADMMAAKKKSKARIKSYSLSMNTMYVYEAKQNYIAGKLSEEEAKTILLKQKVCGPAV